MQKDVRFDIGFGVPGEIAFDGPCRAQSGVIHSDDPANNVVGRYFTRSADGTFAAGGSGFDGGILANPKAYAAVGTPSEGTLGATLTLPNGTVGEFVMEGEIIVRINNAVAPGYELQYAMSTGILSAFPPGTALGPGQAELPGAKITRVRQDDFGGGLAVVWLSNQTRGIPPAPPPPPSGD
jgi:hypothetical protein